jgi:hypothetical protein
MKNTLYISLLTAFLLACGSKASNQQTSESAVQEIPATEQNSGSSSVISNYMTLKDALVQTDAIVAKEAASKLAQSATAENWDANIIQAAEAIASSDDVEAQRTAFKNVTDGLILSLKANGSEDGVYVQYCPMAFDNTGANWLSLSEEIRNPYFGDMMLKCGRVEEKL